MPEPSLVPPAPRKGLQKVAPTLPLKIELPRAVLERLVARASRENYPSLAALLQAVLAREGTGEALGAACYPSSGETRRGGTG